MRRAKALRVEPRGIESPVTSAPIVAIGSENAADRTTRDDATRPGITATRLTVDVLRAKLDAAIVAEAWEAVKVIGARLREVDREGVVELEVARRRRER